MLGMEFLKASWIPLLLLILALVFRMLKQSRAASFCKLHPGPTPFPIIGNLAMISRLPHRSLCSLSHKYGPIMTLYLGSLPTIVISSPQMAKQVLKTQDHLFASRPVMGDDNHILSPHKIATAEYGPYWKLMRKMFVQEILSPKKMDSCASLRAREVCAMTHSILETVLRNGSGACMAVDVTKEVTYFTGNIVSTMTFGRKCYESVEIKITRDHIKNVIFPPPKCAQNQKLHPRENIYKLTITPLEGSCNEVEAQGLLEGVKLAVNIVCLVHAIEGDSHVIIGGVWRGFALAWNSEYYIKNILFWLGKVSVWNITHVYWKANSVVDYLANQGINRHDNAIISRGFEAWEEFATFLINDGGHI
ncbi:hypothetical protein KI387_016511 [Taxus chinensis]|uniref:RNase H type-1 domain-containing protein n=1 Tax=Taxus chinensis TaxID=29808 RepID=A0AA38GH09_TAXCH|nr:hypothetical protein KI387_016511 [Taxus chinensis]